MPNRYANMYSYAEQAAEWNYGYQTLLIVSVPARTITDDDSPNSIVRLRSPVSVSYTNICHQSTKSRVVRSAIHGQQ